MKKKPLIIIVSIVILISVYLVLAHFVPSICIHFKGEYIDAVPATCTETGFSSGYRCKLCGKIYTGHEVTPTIAHKFKKTIIRESTCIEEGLSNNVCSVCGLECTLAEKKADHRYNQEIIRKPTCTQEGLSRFTCTVCGDSYEKTLQLKNHAFGAWTVIKEPTCTEKGSKTATCKDCLYVETHPIDALGHDINARTNACTRCDYVNTASVSLSSSERQEAKKIKYIAYVQLQYNDEKGYYEFLFSLLDESNNELRVPAIVDVTIENNEGEVVYRASLPVLSSDYASWSNAFSAHIKACVRIYDDDIRPSDSTYGTMYYKVHHDSWGSFNESTREISGLPKYDPIIEYSSFLKKYPYAKESIKTAINGSYSFRMTSDLEATYLFDPIQVNAIYSRDGEQWAVDVTQIDTFGNETEYKFIFDGQYYAVCDYGQKIARKTVYMDNSVLEGINYILKCLDPLTSNTEPDSHGNKVIDGITCNYLCYKTDDYGDVVYYFYNNRLTNIEIHGDLYRTELSNTYSYNAFYYPTSFKTYY